jgi:hypothetical protein
MGWKKLAGRRVEGSFNLQLEIWNLEFEPPYFVP